MSKVLNKVQIDHNTIRRELNNGLGSEVKPSKKKNLSTQDKGVTEEISQYTVEETAIGCKVIALRLHHLELGQKKILRTIADLHPIVLDERMTAHNQKVSVVEEELYDQQKGERLVKINLSSHISDIQPDVRLVASKRNESSHSKSVLKMSTSSDSSLQAVGEKPRFVAFKLDKECQTDSSHDGHESKYISFPSQASTDDEDMTSRCSCFDDQPSDNTRTHSEIKLNGFFHEGENFQYIDSNQDDIPNGVNTNDAQKDLAEKLRKKDKEIARLKKKLNEATTNLEAALSSASLESKKVDGIDLGSESPLNLFIQCFKKKYDISVNPNDIAIFV